MNPFFFGSTERRLFGVYEAAAAGTAGKRAAILCSPWGAEYLHAHRSLRKLALRLSEAGFHTLRFDYYGTGDSGDESSDSNLVNWEADLKTAVQELQEITGLARFTLIGLRLGGTVAAAVTSSMPSMIDALVLWDPVLSGPEYLNSLGAPTDNILSSLEIQGFILSEPFMRQLREMDMSNIISELRLPTLILVSDRLQSHEMLKPVMERKQHSIAVEFLDDVCPWLETSLISGLVPSLVFHEVLKWLNDSKN
jgi:uncharacterized protein